MKNQDLKFIYLIIRRESTAIAALIFFVSSLISMANYLRIGIIYLLTSIFLMVCGYIILYMFLKTNKEILKK